MEVWQRGYVQPNGLDEEGEGDRKIRKAGGS